MTAPDEGLLTTREGVDEGSAASTAEGRRDFGGSPAPGGLLDAPDGERSAPPVDTETEESAAQPRPGQQLQAGEG